MVNIICKVCGIEFLVKNNRALTATYCSRRCYSIGKSYLIIAGVKNNYLTTIREVESEPQICNGKVSWARRVECQCDCGRIVVTRLTSFVTGYAKSCGCIPKLGRMDGIGGALSRHPLHRVWSNMIQRCTNKNNENYKHYGGRGITVCEEWRGSFRAFYEWAIQNGWSKGLVLDKDFKGGHEYSPSNCVFLTSSESMNYIRTNRVFYIEGIRYTLQQLSEKHDISRAMIMRNLKNGEDITEAIKKKRG